MGERGRLMRIPWPARSHAPWETQLDAFVDGELDAAAQARLEAHLASCHRCSRQVEVTRSLKSTLASLPELPAPRSFHLTPEMVAGARVTVSPPPRPSRVPLLVAQVATGLAVAGFGAVFAFDRLSNKSPSNTAASAPLAASAAGSALKTPAVAFGGEKKAALGIPSPTPTSAPILGVASPTVIGVTGQGLPSQTPTPEPPRTGPGPGSATPPALPTAPPSPEHDEESPFAAPRSPGAAPSPATPLVPGIQATPLVPAAGSTTSTRRSGWFVPAEATFAALAAIALVSTIVLAVRRRRN